MIDLSMKGCPLPQEKTAISFAKGAGEPQTDAPAGEL